MSKEKKRIFMATILLASAAYFMNSEYVFAESNNLSGKATIEYQAHDVETSPQDPGNPGTNVDPGDEYTKTEGPLRFDFVPKLHFGHQEISKKDQSYFVDAQLFKDDTPVRANYVQITDNRGSLAGWELTIKQEQPFLLDDNKSTELKGAILSFDNQWANSTVGKEYQPTIVKDAIKIEEIGTSYSVAKAAKGTGFATWMIVFGNSEEGPDQTLSPLLNSEGKAITDPTYNNQPVYKNSAIKLYVPGNTEKLPGKYSTVLTWTISELT